jgi:hypothetical protein
MPGDERAGGEPVPGGGPSLIKKGQNSIWLIRSAFSSV